MEKIKQLFKKNPYYGFIAAIVAVTLLLGAISFAVTRPKNGDDKITPTPVKEKFDENATGSDVDSSSHGGKDTGEDTDVSPTKVQATETPAVTSAPTSTPTPAVSKVNINLLGNLYEDKNCNNNQDPDEDFVRKVVTVNIYKMPGTVAYTSTATDGSGHYSYNSSIDKDSSIDLQPMPVAPDGYKIGKYEGVTKTLNKDNPSQRVDIGLVPNANVGACSSN